MSTQTENQTVAPSNDEILSEYTETSQDFEQSQEKKRKPVIERPVFFTETKKNHQRIVTVFYQYDRVNKKLRYGATIFKTNKNEKGKLIEHCDKQAHLKTAKYRFDKYPIFVENVEDNSNLKVFNNQIRKMLFKYGVKSKKN